jgi:hypothetical protein
MVTEPLPPSDNARLEPPRPRSPGRCLPALTVELTVVVSPLFVVRQARAMVAQVVAALQCAGEGDDPMLLLEALGPNLGLDDNYRRRLPGGARGRGSPSGPHVVPGILGTSRAAGKVNWVEAAAAAQVGVAPEQLKK